MWLGRVPVGPGPPSAARGCGGGLLVGAAERDSIQEDESWPASSAALPGRRQPYQLWQAQQADVCWGHRCYHVHLRSVMYYASCRVLRPSLLPCSSAVRYLYLLLMCGIPYLLSLLPRIYIYIRSIIFNTCNKWLWTFIIYSFYSLFRWTTLVNDNYVIFYTRNSLLCPSMIRIFILFISICSQLLTMSWSCALTIWNCRRLVN